MRSTLAAIAATPNLRSQIIATGMHLSAAHGRTVDQIEHVDAVVDWPSGSLAAATGIATAGIADALDRLRSDVVLVVGDRVEAFAAAAAGTVSGRCVAHVHGGDRAIGQVDDSLRHAITKLAHVHFPATKQSERRILRLGEDPWRVHRAGSPGLDGIGDGADFADCPPGRYGLVVLHPTEGDESAEFARASMVLDAVAGIGFDSVVAVYPNNDPGWAGVAKCLDRRPITVHKNLDRTRYLGLLARAAVLVGNSSSGIIEAASFGTPVIDVGNRQRGRERGGNVRHVDFDAAAIDAALRHIWNDGRPRRWRGRNVYASPRAAGSTIAAVLSELVIDRRLTRKLIAY